MCFQIYIKHMGGLDFSRPLSIFFCLRKFYEKSMYTSFQVPCDIDKSLFTFIGNILLFIPLDLMISEIKKSLENIYLQRRFQRMGGLEILFFGDHLESFLPSSQSIFFCSMKNRCSLPNFLLTFLINYLPNSKYSADCH